jgi:hypothetical protein
VGDWDGDGLDGPGLVVGNKWHIRHDWWRNDVTKIAFGRDTDLPVVWGRQVSRK